MKRNHGYISFIMCTIYLLLSVIINGCGDCDSIDKEKSFYHEKILLNETFRIDIKTITATLDFEPESRYVDGEAEITFVMRPKQTRPLIHFDPGLRYDAISEIRLNGETLDFHNAADVEIVSFEGTTQQAIEFQRELPQTVEHTLMMRYRFYVEYYLFPLPYFVSNVNDIDGIGNEEVFPTINSPEELAHHNLTFRVRSDETYSFIGSGLVTQTGSNSQQEWVLNTEREVSSYTVMWVMMPSDDVVYDKMTISDVEVRIMSYIGGASIESAFNELKSWIPELIENLGPFPMPRGISIFLTSLGWGMEYYGGTITDPRALNHEVFHMYFGCSTVAKTYRDSWWDEAIDVWYEDSILPGYEAIPADYRSNIVGGRSPIAVGFDTRAYDEGAHIMEAVAQEVGGREVMISFLKYVHQNYTFSPFNTMDFVTYLNDYTGVDMRDRFRQWLYSEEESYYQQKISGDKQIYRVNMTPPEHILRKYGFSLSDDLPIANQ
ncbi:hypothetical protein ACFL27_16155 [candidate division CSSED10-310 bacterium]|uniref:Peptidase M1 membrane alanine aminopeptidase domain-containing protein n=1 Tax=candidate division CSSED10-310 bacterium TaxID=2855610 RepID=A0ABV6YZV5_UNCC1